LEAEYWRYSYTHYLIHNVDNLTEPVPRYLDKTYTVQEEHVPIRQWDGTEWYTLFVVHYDGTTHMVYKSVQNRSQTM